MTTLSPKEFKLFVKTMSSEYEEHSYDLKEVCEDIKRENELLKMVLAKLTKENTQLHMKCKQYEINEKKQNTRKEREKEGKEGKEELIKLDSVYFRKKLNL